MHCNRVTDRHGLYTIDGEPLHTATIRAAHVGMEHDVDLVHLSVRDMVSNLCRIHIGKITREFDLDNGFWRTIHYDEAGRYADDIIKDWRIHGEDTFASIYDTTLCYIRVIQDAANSMPNRVLHDSDWEFTPEYGTAPKSIYPPSKPPDYKYGEGHTIIPDGTTHPLIAHLSSPEPCPLKDGNSIHMMGAIPHRLSGCDACVSFAPRKTVPSTYEFKNRRVSDIEKTNAILKMIYGIEPQVAFLCEVGARHSILVSDVNLDVSHVYQQVDELVMRFGTPIDCLVTDHQSLHDLLYADAYGNDAKRIIRQGKLLVGTVSEPLGKWIPPRPAAISRADMLHNMERHGFEMIVPRIRPHRSEMRVEYTITSAHFNMEPRWYITGFAVMLCKNTINWHLMLYLAKTYGYLGTLHGILEELVKNDQKFDESLSILRQCAYKPVPTESDTVQEALEIYVH